MRGLGSGLGLSFLRDATEAGKYRPEENWFQRMNGLFGWHGCLKWREYKHGLGVLLVYKLFIKSAIRT